MSDNYKTPKPYLPPPPTSDVESEPENSYHEPSHDRINSNIEIPNVAVRKGKPRISEVNRRVDELTVAQNETGREMADAIVDTAYKQMSRHHELEFTNRQQQSEIEFLKTKMARLEKLIESASLNPSLSRPNPMPRSSECQNAYSPTTRQRFQDEEEEEEDILRPSVSHYRTQKSPTRRIEYKRQSTARLRSSEEPNFQGPPFAKYRDPSETVGQTYGNVRLGTANRIINPICEFGGIDNLDFFENWLILLRGRIQDNDGHWGSDRRIMNFIFASTKAKAQEMLVPYFSGEDVENDFVNSVQMVNHLIASHRSSTLQRDSMVEFESLRQGTYESFQNFKTRFLSLAGKAKIHHSLRRDLMYGKMNRQLKLAVYTQLHRCPDFNSLCEFAEPVDKERIRLEKSSTNKPEKLNSSRRLYQPESSTLASNRQPNSRPDSRQEQKLGIDVTCYYCKKLGHTKSECPFRTPNNRHTTVQVIAEESSSVDSDLCSEDEVDVLENDPKGKVES